MFLIILDLCFFSFSNRILLLLEREKDQQKHTHTRKNAQKERKLNRKMPKLKIYFLLFLIALGNRVNSGDFMNLIILLILFEFNSYCSK